MYSTYSHHFVAVHPHCQSGACMWPTLIVDVVRPYNWHQADHSATDNVVISCSWTEYHRYLTLFCPSPSHALHPEFSHEFPSSQCHHKLCCTSTSLPPFANWPSLFPNQQHQINVSKNKVSANKTRRRWWPASNAVVVSTNTQFIMYVMHGAMLIRFTNFSILPKRNVESHQTQTWKCSPQVNEWAREKTNYYLATTDRDSPPSPEL